ncbi:MAG TPA: thioredoxin family protein [Acidimicrobiales bacterium]|nr:thioredoxin family protein [Acidimicrobiales bacterium]
MDRLAPMLAVLVVALIVAFVLRRRKPAAPTQPQLWPAPVQLDRADFVRPAAPWLVAVFTSATCEGCARVTAKAEVLAGDEVAYEAVPFQERRDLHERYGVEAAPTTVIADADGVVQKSFVGDVSATDLWAALASLREGTGPEP